MDLTVDPSDEVDEVELAGVLSDIDVVSDKDLLGLKVDNEDDVDAVKVRRDCEDVIDVAEMTVSGDDEVDVVPDVREDVDVVGLKVNACNDDDVNFVVVAGESPMQETATSSWCPQS